MKRIMLIFIGLSWLSLVDARSEEPVIRYRGYLDFAIGDAYNFNTSQLISTNNMQLFSVITTTHGYVINNWFVGAGTGYYYSYRDKENMFSLYAAGRYTFEDVRMNPYVDIRGGIVYDPYWINKVQAYGAIGAGINVYKGLQVGLRATVFSRPSRFFTANAAVVIGYAFGK